MKKGGKGIFLSQLPPAARQLVEKQLQAEDLKRARIERQSPATPAPDPSEGSDTTKGKKRGKKRREMNATEREFMAFIGREWPGRKIEYESITLRWGEGSGLLTYTPDFLIKIPHSSSGKHPYLLHLFFEVKGAWAWQKDIVKFKAARAQFPEYEFQLWEKDDAGRWHNTI